MRRVLVAAIAVALLIVVAAAPVSAETIRRTWKGAVGTAGANGSASLVVLQEGYGRLSVSLRALRADATYSVEIRKGTCSSPGTVLARPASFRTDGLGAVTVVRGLSTFQTSTVWSYARYNPVAVRFVSGSSVKCGNLAFNRATRVRVPGYSIDLPVIKGPSGYPPCRVAMYLKELSQPREPGVTFLFAHARTGMFLPLLSASRVNNGAALIGKVVYVYTSDSWVHTYKITRVRRHLTSIQGAFGVTAERLWLYTSEGPNYTYPKLVIEAQRTRSAKTTYSASHPTARPISC